MQFILCTSVVLLGSFIQILALQVTARASTASVTADLLGGNFATAAAHFHDLTRRRPTRRGEHFEGTVVQGNDTLITPFSHFEATARDWHYCLA